MADATYDAVIVGGGTKSLITAMYLAKYAGMSVGIFEMRMELGGSLKQIEGAAPGFVADYCGSELGEFGYLPIERDFPTWEMGLRFAECKVGATLMHMNKHEFIPFYSTHADPTGEKTAKEITRVASAKDADMFMKARRLSKEEGLDKAMIKDCYTLPERGEKYPLEQWYEDYLKRPDCFLPASVANMKSDDILNHVWETEIMRYSTVFYPTLYTAFEGVDRTVPVDGRVLGIQMLKGYLHNFGTIRRAIGGSHSVAHAYVRILLANGAKFFTNSKVDKVIVEDGRATGIRLVDGTEIAAQKLVVSGMPIGDTAVELIGKEQLSPEAYKVAQRIYKPSVPFQETWYTWAVHEPPKWWASDINPDINDSHVTFLGTDNDVEALNKRHRALFDSNELPGARISVMRIPADTTRAPAGKEAIMTREMTLGAYLRTEREWIKYKKEHAEKTIETFKQFAPNMTWDNVIGYCSLSPWDHRNFCLRGLGGFVGQPDLASSEEVIPGFKDMRTPIKNLYGSGDSWNPKSAIYRFTMGATVSAGTDCSEGYLCYKTIAKDFRLENQPWEGQEW